MTQLKNGDTISTEQVVLYKNHANSCQGHCMEVGNNFVCGKAEFCCNKTTTSTQESVTNIMNGKQ